jgi:hypothetical protein
VASLYSPQPPKSKPKPVSASVDAVLERLLSKLTPVQKRFVLDESRNKVARCSRRAGKTYAEAVSMLYTALKDPKSPIAYFGLTKDSAKEAVWQELKDRVEDCGIECDVSDPQLSVTFPNGSVIRLFGLDMDNIKNRFRGRKFKKAVVDECAFYASVDNFVTSVLTACLMDLQGTLEMASSPGLVKSGLFYHADEGKQKDLWSRYNWTIHDNPHFQQPSKNSKYLTLADEELDKVCILRFGGDREHPEFRREFLGEWVFDAQSLVYPLDEAHVISKEYAVRSSEYAVGFNLSQHGRQGYVVVKYSDYARTVQVVESVKLKCKNLNALASCLKDLQETYETDLIYVYLGDEHADIIDDFKQRYDVPIQASRYDKLPFYQTIISTDMDSGYVEVVNGCDLLLDEFNSTVKDDEGVEIAGESTVLADAFFAVYLNLYNTVLKAVEAPEAEDDRMERELRENIQRELDDYRIEQDDSY